MSDPLYIGVDPGCKGGVTVLDAAGSIVLTAKLSKHSWSEVCDLLDLDGKTGFAVIEQVSAFPGQGVVSCFKFGESYGVLQGLLIGQRIPFERITPSKWQRMFIPTRKGESKTSHKNRLKSVAHELFPGDRKSITLENADSVLLSEYARRSRLGIEK